MFYPSKEEPVFFRKDDSISVFPAPGASPNAFKVNYVDNAAGAFTRLMTYSGNTAILEENIAIFLNEHAKFSKISLSLNSTPNLHEFGMKTQ